MAINFVPYSTHSDLYGEYAVALSPGGSAAQEYSLPSSLSEAERAQTSFPDGNSFI